MRVLERLPTPGGVLIGATEGAVWLIKEDWSEEGAFPQPILQIEPGAPSRITGVDHGDPSIAGGWQITETDDGLWIATPNGSDPPGGFDPGADPAPDIRDAFRAGRPVKADLLTDGVAGGLILIDPDSKRVKRTVLFLDWGPDSIAATDEGLWITAGASDGSILVLFDPREGAVRVIERSGYGLLRSGAGTLWSCGEGGVERLDHSTGETIFRIDVAAHDCEVTAAGVWVATGDELLRLEPERGRILSRLSVAVDEVAADAHHVVAKGWRSSTVVHIDTRSNEVDASVNVGGIGENVVSDLTVAFGSAWVITDEEVVRISLPRSSHART